MPRLVAAFFIIRRDMLAVLAAPRVAKSLPCRLRLPPPPPPAAALAAVSGSQLLARNRSIPQLLAPLPHGNQTAICTERHFPSS